MTPEKAESIVNAYGTALELSAGMVARPKSLLPCPPEEVAKALVTYISVLIDLKALDKNIEANLLHGSAYLLSFVDDEYAVRVNRVTSASLSSGQLTAQNLEEYTDFIRKRASDPTLPQKLTAFIQRYR